MDPRVEKTRRNPLKPLFQKGEHWQMLPTSPWRPGCSVAWKGKFSDSSNICPQTFRFPDRGWAGSRDPMNPLKCFQSKVWVDDSVDTEKLLEHQEVQKEGRQGKCRDPVWAARKSVHSPGINRVTSWALAKHCTVLKCSWNLLGSSK